METITYAHEVKAIKEHCCNFCGDKISKGETYKTSTHKCDGTLYDWKSHKHCADIASRLNMYEECDEGLTADGFQECIHNAHDDILIEMFPQNEINKYSAIIQQLRHVIFRQKLRYVIRYYAKIDKDNAKQ